MTSSRNVLAMIRSHAAGDSVHFLSIAEHIAGEAARSGKTKVAEEITAAVQRAKLQPKASTPPTPIAAARGELAGLMRVTYPEVRLSDLVVGGDLQRRLRRLVREHDEAEALKAMDLSPRRKFLFSGPPGTGKSMTAAAIAGELGLPLFTVMLDGIITKFMGETAAKLRLVFDAMRATRGVYLFDEVDALAARRASENDIGEARRMLNSFLMFLEEDNSGSVVIAATNLRSLLDTAIFRRFDAAFVYAKPSTDEARRVLVNHLRSFAVSDLDWTRIDECTTGLSQADIVSAAADAARDAVLDNASTLTTDIVCQALADRASIHVE
ncbi:ATP-binding protein [Methylobacterium sp. WL69]|uniref:AAA family ATPase n=1 Tax=Methylobacterium sp. WL69 TaxID=2603893 RepID=UPI0011CC7E23|nr:ATP-binding protein [Methylobacterium sp. WL69]TXM73737.1 ATP-binding protein [Methylobacterium sp. WL69]